MQLDIEIDPSELQLDVLTVLPVSVHTRPSCNVVVWESKAKDDEDWNEIKITIAKLMDRLVDLMRDYQEYSPFVALIDVKEESIQWKKIIGDQDWHRGRFILQEIRSNEGQSVDMAKNRWLGKLQKGQYRPRKISNDDFVHELTRVSKIGGPPKGVEISLYDRYVDILRESIEGGRSDQFIEVWKDELVNDINNLIGERIIEGNRHGG